MRESGPRHDSWLLDVPPLRADEVVSLEQDLGQLLDTRRDIVLFGSEATLALEAIAVSLGRPGLRVLNVVTGPYGALFGDWLSSNGSEVRSLVAPPRRAISADAVSHALGEQPTDVLCVVHAEAATGLVNDLQAIGELARRHDVITVVDAVASVGAEPLAIDDDDIDLLAIGPQKSLAGPTGISAVTVSDRAWQMLGTRTPPVRSSSMSLLDWKDRWLDTQRTAMPGYLPVLETRALAASVTRALDEGLAGIVARHHAAAAATRAGVEALGLQPWAAVVGEAAGVATVVAAPSGVAPAELVTAAQAVAASCLEVAPGGLRDTAVRVTHSGRRATWPDVAAAITGLHGALTRFSPSGPPVSLGQGLDTAWRAFTSD